MATHRQVVWLVQIFLGVISVIFGGIGVMTDIWTYVYISLFSCGGALIAEIIHNFVEFGRGPLSSLDTETKNNATTSE